MVQLNENTYFLELSNSILTEMDNSTMLTVDNITSTIPINPHRGTKSVVEMVPWGENNNLPLQILEKSYKNVTIASNLGFNATINYGDGLIVVKKNRNKETNQVELVELMPSDEPEIFDFLEANNVPGIIQELSQDIAVYGDSYVEFITNSNKKIASIRNKEMCYSRVSKMNMKGEIEWHLYSSQWSMQLQPDDVVATKLIDRRCPLLSMKKYLGLAPLQDGNAKDSGYRRFCMSVAMPTPSRFYYNKPYWWSIFESGWYDFANAIPTFKKALINNQIALKYHVQVNTSLWDKLYTSEHAVNDADKTSVKTKFLDQIDQFLSGGDNAGKSFVSQFEYDRAANIEKSDVKIDVIKSQIEGGEYLDDTEEVNNIICYAMGIHPSLIGATPGKNSNINGSEARELFTIKQAITKPIRDMLLAPLYIVKRINHWNPDVFFYIPNIMLTTLDNGTGAIKSIGNQKIS